MLTARGYLAGVLGSDGQIYAIGGSDSAGSGRNSLKTVEAYRTGADFWSTKANMNVARQALGAAEGNDGRIYAFGGATAFSSVAVTNTAECFSPTLNKWTLVANMPTGRVALAGATGSDGQIYAMGGSPDYGFTIVNTVEAYNTSSGTWSTRAAMNTAREFPAAATGNDGRIYVFGGLTSAGTVLNTVECYSPTLNKWTTVAPMPTARALAAAVLGSNGRLFVIGGTTSSSLSTPTNVVESYNPNTNTWSTVLPPMPTARSGLGAATGNDGRIYAFGGYDGVGTALTVNQSLQAYGGFAGAAPAKSPIDVSGDLTSSLVSTATVTVTPQSAATDQGAVPSSRASDDTDAVFAVGVESLSANLTDELFAGSIG